MNYERGFKRMYAVFAICWSAVCVMSVLSHSQGLSFLNAIGAVLVAIAVPLILGYLLFFRAIPWIVRGFK